MLGQCQLSLPNLGSELRSYTTWSSIGVAQSCLLRDCNQTSMNASLTLSIGCGGLTSWNRLCVHHCYGDAHVATVLQQPSDTVHCNITVLVTGVLFLFPNCLTVAVFGRCACFSAWCWCWSSNTCLVYRPIPTQCLRCVQAYTNTMPQVRAGLHQHNASGAYRPTPTQCLRCVQAYTNTMPQVRAGLHQPNASGACRPTPTKCLRCVQAYTNTMPQVRTGL